VSSVFALTLYKADDLGFRLRNLDREAVKAFTLTHYLVFILYFLGMAFVLSAAVVVRGACAGATQTQTVLTRDLGKRLGFDIATHLFNGYLHLPCLLCQ
jgi:hypothetical protein